MGGAWFSGRWTACSPLTGAERAPLRGTGISLCSAPRIDSPYPAPRLKVIGLTSAAPSHHPSVLVWTNFLLQPPHFDNTTHKLQHTLGHRPPTICFTPNTASTCAAQLNPASTAGQPAQATFQHRLIGSSHRTSSQRHTNTTLL